MGADDLLEPNFVERVTRAVVENPGISMVHPGVKVINESNLEISTRSDHVKTSIRETQGYSKILKGEPLAKSLMKGNWMYFPSIVWKTRTIQDIGFRPGFHVCQDLGLAMDLIMQGGQMLLIEDEIFRYRRHQGSDSSVKAINGERFLEEKRFFRIMAKELKKIGWSSASRAAQIHSTSRLHAASLIPNCISMKQNPLPLIKHSLL